MSHQDKLARAKALIDSHNQQVEDKADRVDSSSFEKKLKALGGTTEDALQECTWEDLEQCGLPRILARKVAEIFRAKSVTVDNTVVSPKRASAMAPLYLIQQYNPNEIDSAITKELLSRSQGKRFVVFNIDGSVNVEESHKLYQEIARRWPEREFITVDGKTCRVFRIGEGKVEMADESPLYPGRILRPDGTDDQLNRSWDGVPLNVRQLIYLAVTKTGEIKVSNTVAHDILDMALLPDGEQKIRQRCKKSSVLLDELTEQGDAPKLKINRTAANTQDPFFRNTTY